MALGVNFGRAIFLGPEALGKQGRIIRRQKMLEEFVEHLVGNSITIHHTKLKHSSQIRSAEPWDQKNSQSQIASDFPSQRPNRRDILQPECLVASQHLNRNTVCAELLGHEAIVFGPAISEKKKKKKTSMRSRCTEVQNPFSVLRLIS